MNMWDFFHHHPFLAWCALWLLWPAGWIILTIVIRLPNRILRCINIVTRGWPPEHLDADGDWKREDGL